MDRRQPVERQPASLDDTVSILTAPAHNVPEVMREKSEQPQQEPIERERKSEHVLAPPPPEQPPGDICGQVIFDRLTAMQQQLQQIDQKLQMYIDLVRESREVREDLDTARGRGR